MISTILSPALNAAYQASPIKRRRRTNADLSVLHGAIIDCIQALQPMTLRQLFYALTVRDVIEKTERDYNAVGVQLLKLRRRGLVPWSAITDNTRWVRRPETFRGPAEAVRSIARFYRPLPLGRLRCPCRGLVREGRVCRRHRRGHG